MKTVHVAAGIIQRDGENGEAEFLAVRRGYGDMAGLWEFPGGKVERGETAAEACARELQEELRVSVTNLRDFYSIEYDYPDFHLSMQCFFCRLTQDAAEPQARDRQQEMRWVPRRSLADLTWMPADIELVDALTAGDTAAERQDAPDENGEESEGAIGTASAQDGHIDAPRAGEKTAPKRTARKAPGPRKTGARKRSRRKKPGLLDGIDTSDLTAHEIELVRRRTAVRKSMQGNKRANTKPELLVRRRLREAGLTGYRLDWAKAPGRPDIAFPGRKVAIFVNGCYWHRCPNCHPSTPKRNVEFWEAKFRRNVERDRRALAELHDLGWTALTVWECELKRDRIDETMARVIETVRAAQPARTRPKRA